MIEGKLKLGHSRIIPFPGYYAITVYGWLIRNVKYKGKAVSNTTMNHETIHALQAEDFVPNPKNKTFNKILGYTIFYIWYFIEWIIRLILRLFTWGKVKAYSGISFEQEAYSNQYTLTYTENRKRFAWLQYLFKSGS